MDNIEVSVSVANGVLFCYTRRELLFFSKNFLEFLNFVVALTLSPVNVRPPIPVALLI